MFRWKFSFWSYTPARTASNPHMRWDLWAPQYQCLLAEMPITLCAGVKAEIYWTCKAFDTWETKTDSSDCSLSWYFWYFKTAFDTIGKVSSFSWTKWEEKPVFDFISLPSPDKPWWQIPFLFHLNIDHYILYQQVSILKFRLSHF